MSMMKRPRARGSVPPGGQKHPFCPPGVTGFSRGAHGMGGRGASVDTGNARQLGSRLTGHARPTAASTVDREALTAVGTPPWPMEGHAGPSALVQCTLRALGCRLTQPFQDMWKMAPCRPDGAQQSNPQKVSQNKIL